MGADFRSPRLAAVLIVMALAGCAKPQGSVLRPGAISSFDQSAFETLVTLQAALEEARSGVQLVPAVRPALNEAIALYNSTLAMYRVYHAAGAPAAAAADLATNLRKLTAAVAGILQQLRPSSPLSEVRRQHRSEGSWIVSKHF